MSTTLESINPTLPRAEQFKSVIDVQEGIASGLIKPEILATAGLYKLMPIDQARERLAYERLRYGDDPVAHVSFDLLSLGLDLLEQERAEVSAAQIRSRSR